MTVHIERARNDEEWAELAARRFFESGRAAIRERGAYHVVVPGGRTPRLAFARIVRLTQVDRSELSDACDEICFHCLAWNSVHLYFSDERCVEPTSPESNFGMVRESLLDQVSIPPEQVHRIVGELKPREAAVLYNEMLVERSKILRAPSHRTAGVAEPLFDVVILGLGPDGHTASLVPGRALEFVAQPYAGVGPPPPSAAASGSASTVAPGSASAGGSGGVGQVRVTLTAEALRSTRETVFWVRGADKAEVVRSALRGGEVQTMVPEVIPPGGEVAWILDEPAASLLDSHD